MTTPATLLSYDQATLNAIKLANKYDGTPYEKLQCAEDYLKSVGHNWTFGVESVECADKSVSYLNAGDTYTGTLLCGDDGIVYSGDWGTWYETTENEHCTEENVIRCGYCGEFTSLVEGVKWHDTRCEHCGHNVSSGEVMPEPTDDDDDDDTDDDE